MRSSRWRRESPSSSSRGTSGSARRICVAGCPPDAVGSGQPEGMTSAEKREPVELPPTNRVIDVEVGILKRASAYFARRNVPQRIGFRLGTDQPDSA